MIGLTRKLTSTAIVRKTSCSRSHWQQFVKENSNIQEPLKQLHAVREYCNEQLKQVSITYHCTVNEYDDLFTPHSAKYNMNGEKKK